MLVHEAIQATFTSVFTACTTSLPENPEPGRVVGVPNDGHIALTVPSTSWRAGSSSRSWRRTG